MTRSMTRRLSVLSDDGVQNASDANDLLLRAETPEDIREKRATRTTLELRCVRSAERL